MVNLGWFISLLLASAMLDEIAAGCNDYCNNQHLVGQFKEVDCPLHRSDTTSNIKGTVIYHYRLCLTCKGVHDDPTNVNVVHACKCHTKSADRKGLDAPYLEQVCKNTSCGGKFKLGEFTADCMDPRCAQPTVYVQSECRKCHQRSGDATVLTQCGGLHPWALSLEPPGETDTAIDFLSQFEHTQHPWQSAGPSNPEQSDNANLAGDRLQLPPGWLSLSPPGTTP